MQLQKHLYYRNRDCVHTYASRQKLPKGENNWCRLIKGVLIETILALDGFLVECDRFDSRYLSIVCVPQHYFGLC